MGRVNGRICRRYFGRGLVACLADAQDKLRRAEQELLRQEEIEQRQVAQRVEELVAEADREIELLSSAALLVGGYHQQGRGRWKSEIQDLQEPDQEVLARRHQFERLVSAANASEPGAVEALERFLDDAPEIWQHAGDLAGRSEDFLVAAIAGGNEVLRQSIVRQAERMRTELACPTPSPLENLLVDRIVAGWLHVHFWELTDAPGAEHTPRYRRFAEQRMKIAERRYGAAIRSLALLRKLLPKWK
jgi:hypothetical protein